jgi:hypothetical protein
LDLVPSGKTLLSIWGWIYRQQIVVNKDYPTINSRCSNRLKIVYSSMQVLWRVNKAVCRSVSCPSAKLNYLTTYKSIPFVKYKSIISKKKALFHDPLWVEGTDLDILILFQVILISISSLLVIQFLNVKESGSSYQTIPIPLVQELFLLFRLSTSLIYHKLQLLYLCRFVFFSNTYHKLHCQ